MQVCMQSSVDCMEVSECTLRMDGILLISCSGLL